MKRSELEAMGLTKEQVDGIMKINGEDIENAKSASASELTALKAENTSLSSQVKERDTQIDGLKKSAGDNEEMKKQIEQLQADNKAKDEAHAKELAQLKLDNAIDAALAAAGAKNGKAVKALIDVSKVKLGEDGKLTGWDDQIKAVQKSDAYLFSEKQQTHFRGFQPGASGDVKPGTNVDMSKMTYEELTAYIESNPDA